MTPKPNGFRALGVKHPKDLLTRVKKAMKLNLAIFSSFDVNTQCLMMQEIGLLSEKLKVINIILLLFFFFFFNAKVIPPTCYPAASQILITEITDFKFHTPQTTC
jgi:hypothetical protein